MVSDLAFLTCTDGQTHMHSMVCVYTSMDTIHIYIGLYGLDNLPAVSRHNDTLVVCVLYVYITFLCRFAICITRMEI